MATIEWDHTQPSDEQREQSIRADQRRLDAAEFAAAVCAYCRGPESETRRKMITVFQPELGEWWHPWGDDYAAGRSRCSASPIHAALEGEKNG